MKNKIGLFLSMVAFAITAAIVIPACNKRFDAPPGASDPNITPNYTIKQLKALHTASGQFDVITTDVIVAGVVVADDKSGNLYKEIYIQDATGGIALELDASGLYGTYPVGRKLFINCKGLCLSDYHRMHQLGIKAIVNGAPSLEPIPSDLIKNYITGGSLGNPVVAKVVAFSTLTTAMSDDNLGSLIQLDNFEVQANDINKTYADTSAAKASTNINIANCSNNKLIIRSSGYANFAPIPVAQGNGSVKAIYTTYDNTPQLLIRDTTDVQFNNPRCSAGPATLTSIAAVKALFTGSNVTLGAVKISGTIISDAANKNMSAGNMVIQDGTAGIDLYFGSTAATTNFNVGDSVEINLNSGILQSFNGLIEVGLAAGALPTIKIATGKTVVPLILTTAQFNAQVATIECKLIKIVGAVATPTGTYVGSKTLTDAAGTGVLYTSANATFGGQNLPTVSSDWVGYVTRFNAINQFQIRNLSDVSPSTTPPPPPASSGITLTTSPVTLDFNAIETGGLPTGVTLFTLATPTAFGTAGSLTQAKALWAATGGGFKNFASATGLTATSDQTAQDGSTNRALGIRPVSATDAGNSFVFQIANTTGKTNLGLSFLLQSLDNTVGRTATWTVDYATGAAPTSFTTIGTLPATLTTGPTFISTPVTVSFGAALNNISGPVWIRISSLGATTGSGSRPSTAIDDVKFTWN